jgi:hypothetical protein
MWIPVQLLNVEYSTAINKFIANYEISGETGLLAAQFYYSQEPTAEQIQQDAENYALGLNARDQL